jgi:hypothetical protein
MLSYDWCCVCVILMPGHICAKNKWAVCLAELVSDSPTRKESLDCKINFSCQAVFVTYSFEERQIFHGGVNAPAVSFLFIFYGILRFDEDLF